jgi:hypothetical protein
MSNIGEGNDDDDDDDEARGETERNQRVCLYFKVLKRGDWVRIRE